MSHFFLCPSGKIVIQSITTKTCPQQHTTMHATSLHGTLALQQHIRLIVTRTCPQQDITLNAKVLYPIDFSNKLKFNALMFTSATLPGCLPS
mmetsp:Transcript_2803/g.7332  ORF Transcript_2803/g.7332 Transcript_2803/m.7332 type:complete len:92 (-) Transcript_2803:139-414(-)